MAAAAIPEKKCGICSKPITTGYFTYGDYCGTTVCLVCLSKNTWSMCRKCNGSLFTNTSIPHHVDKSEIAGKSSSEVKTIYWDRLDELQKEHIRLEEIEKYAEEIRRSAHSARYYLERLKTKLYEESIETYTNLCIEEERVGEFKFFKLISSPDQSSEPHPLEHIKTQVEKVYMYQPTHTLTLNPSSKTLRVRVHRRKNVVYKMDHEYRDIVSKHGHACEIELMQSQDFKSCVAIKTKDGNVHIIYAEEIEYPYEKSRYIGYDETPHSLSSLRLELFIHIRQAKPWFL